jgi:hypothetical protein
MAPETTDKSASSEGAQPDIKVLLLVPRNIVAEVLRYSFVEFNEDDDSGINSFDWRGCNVPLISNSLLGDIAEADLDEDTRVVICYGLQNNHVLPFYGFTVLKSPQLLQLTETDMTEITDAPLHPGELMKVTMEDAEVIIPKVEYFETPVLKLIH